MVNRYEVLELRNYRVEAKRRDAFVEHFRKHFVHTQEQCGIGVLGYFAVQGNADRFFWIRAFDDMSQRKTALEEFYGGPAWRDNRGLANEIMTEWDDVLLVRPAASSPAIAPHYVPQPDRPPKQNTRPARSLVVATIPLSELRQDFPEWTDAEIRSIANNAAATEVARFVTEPASNDYAPLPVRDDLVLVTMMSAPTHTRKLARDLAALAGGRGRVLTLLAAPGSHLPELDNETPGRCG